MLKPCGSSPSNRRQRQRACTGLLLAGPVVVAAAADAGLHLLHLRTLAQIQCLLRPREPVAEAVVAEAAVGRRYCRRVNTLCG